MPKKKMTLKEFAERYECCYSAAGVRLKKLIAKDKKVAKHVSREALLFEVFSKLQNEAEKQNPAFGKILHSEIPPKQKLIKLHFEAMKMMLKYGKYVKAITKYALFGRSISASRGSLPFIQAHFGDRKTESECRLIAYEISSIHELAMLRQEEIKAACGIDLTDEKVLLQYVTDHINMFLGE